MAGSSGRTPPILGGVFFGTENQLRAVDSQVRRSGKPGNQQQLQSLTGARLGSYCCLGTLVNHTSQAKRPKSRLRSSRIGARNLKMLP